MRGFGRFLFRGGPVAQPKIDLLKGGQYGPCHFFPGGVFGEVRADRNRLKFGVMNSNIFSRHPINYFIGVCREFITGVTLGGRARWGAPGGAFCWAGRFRSVDEII